MQTDDLRLPRSFTWMNVAQFFGALNDNVFKLLVVFLLISLGGSDNRAEVITIATVVFVLPFLLFSHAGGLIADRYSKRNVVVWLKALEILIALCGCAAVLAGNPFGLYAVLFILCTQSALFSPSKYGIVPELVGNERLSKANGVLEAATYVAIIAGSFLPSFFVTKLAPAGVELTPAVLKVLYFKLGLVCVLLAVVGFLASLGISKTGPGRSNRKFSPLFIVDLARTVRYIAQDGYLLLAILGSAIFMLIAALIQQNVILFGQDHLNMDTVRSGYLFPVTAVGIGLGSLLSGKFSGRNIEFGLVPLGAFGLAIASMSLGAVRHSVIAAEILLALIGFFSGLFIVPLNAFIQFRAPADRRGEILGCTNFLGFLGITLSAGLLYVLNGIMGFSPNECFVVAGMVTALLAAAGFAVLPDFFVRFVALIITKCIYRIRVAGTNNVPVDGPALLVSNHVTWVDGLLIAATQQRRVRFVMDQAVYGNPWLNPLFRLMKVIPVSAKSPHGVKSFIEDARAALADGYLLCIFAEGALTRNGNMRAFRPGLERILEGTDYPVIPVHIGDGWGSIFSYCKGKLFSGFPKKIPYDITIAFGAPLSARSSAFDVRQAVLELSDTPFNMRKSPRRNLSSEFVGVARKHWGKPCISDTTGKKLSFGRALTGAIALADELEKTLAGQDKVGILLPSSVGGVLANLAVTMTGRVGVNLNFTASAESVRAALRVCGIRTVVSSHAFIEKLAGFEVPQGTVYIEDIMPRIDKGAMFKALLKARFAPAASLQTHRRVGADDLVTVVFSSGSTGEPKGVMITHHNIMSNVESFRAVMRFKDGDAMTGVLPLFHSFGYTCTMWCPLLSGFSAMYHPNPLDGGKIAEIVRENKLTILLSTPTFLLAYIRRAAKEDFASLRLVVAGAEKLKARVADSFQERFGVRPVEGYGATELSPVAALNIHDVEIDGVKQAGTKEGSIGHPIPGCAVRVVDALTGAAVKQGEQGLLLIKGPNVMKGYLEAPERTAEVLRDGWYNTGDIGRVDEDGFVFLTDRLSRFSKIGGEMVPHMGIEDKFQHALGVAHQVVFVTAAPDEKKGEQLILFFLGEAGDVDRISKIAAELDIPNLWKPKKENLIMIESFPTLGSGKMDQKKLKEMAKDMVSKRSGA